mmetsp:Transcript_11845/g.27693  ORF Transcript_11845/g.27693 Transcript_11845/m.27693 type:complete len:205 (-) Transcript_11845:219-833(-)
MRRSLDTEVVAFGRSRGENDLLGVDALFATPLLGGGRFVAFSVGWFSRNERRDLRPGFLDGGFGLPAKGVGFGVWISVRADHVGCHGVQDAGIHGRSGRHVEIGSSALPELSPDRKRGGGFGGEQGFRNIGRGLVPLVGFHLFEGDGRGSGLGGQKAVAALGIAVVVAVASEGCATDACGTGRGRYQARSRDPTRKNPGKHGDV